MTEMQILKGMTFNDGYIQQEEHLAYYVENIERVLIDPERILTMSQKGMIQRKDLVKWILTEDTKETIIKQSNNQYKDER